MISFASQGHAGMERVLNHDARLSTPSPPADPTVDDAADVYAPGAAEVTPAVEEGSYALGFIVVFFCSVMPLILILALGKPRTTRGAWHGLLAQVGLIAALQVIAALVSAVQSMLGQSWI